MGWEDGEGFIIIIFFFPRDLRNALILNIQAEFLCFKGERDKNSIIRIVRGEKSLGILVFETDCCENGISCFVYRTRYKFSCLGILVASP